MAADKSRRCAWLMAGRRADGTRHRGAPVPHGRVGITALLMTRQTTARKYARSTRRRKRKRGSEMTNHFNRLSEAELERLAILIEECGEVAQAACKVIRHEIGRA